MRKFFVLLAVLLMTTVIRAQRVEVEETTATFGKTTYPAMTTQVMFTDAKSVIKEFTTMLKSYNPETLEVKKSLITVDNVIIPAISENPIDIYANITQSKGSDIVNMAVAFSLGANVFITSSQSPTMYPTASNILKVFANDLTAKNRDAILSKLGKEVEKEEKKLASNEKKAAGYQKSIDGYQKNLDKAELKKKEANDNIQSTNAKIEASEQLIKDYARDINPENSGDVIEKASKARDKETKKLESYKKSLTGYNKTIESSNKDIEKNTKGKTKAENSLSSVNKSIEKQREIVREKKDAYKKVENM